MDFMVANGLLSRFSCSEKKKNYVTNLLDTLGYLTNDLSKVNDVNETLLDLSKAFDLVS